MNGLRLLTWVRCPECEELSQVDDLLFFEQKVERDRKRANIIVYIEAECGCDFCGNVWSIEEFFNQD